MPVINPDMLSPDFPQEEPQQPSSNPHKGKKARILENIRHVELIQAENLEDALEKLVNIPLGSYVYFISTRQEGLIEVLQNGKIVWFELASGRGCYAAIPHESQENPKQFDVKAIVPEKRLDRLKRALLETRDIPTIHCEELPEPEE